MRHRNSKLCRTVVRRHSSRIAVAALSAAILMACTGFASAAFAAGNQTTTTTQTSSNQGGNGGGNQGGNGNGGGTATPELPSGVLFGIGLIPLAVGVLWLRRRDRSSAAIDR